MAQTTTSAPQQGVAMPAVDLRQMVGALVATEGVRATSDLVVSQRAAGANMSVDVAAGSCVITDDHASGGGVYSYTLGSTTNVAIGTANATNPRIDRVVVAVLDNALGDASNSATVTVLAGTPTSGATLANLSGAAAVSSSSLLLANVLVPAATSSIVTADIANVVPIVRPAGAAGTVLDFTQITSPSSAVSATTEGTANAIITGNSVTYAGAEVRVEFWTPKLQVINGADLTLVLLRDSTVIGHAVAGGASYSGPTSWGFPAGMVAYDTPTAGAHTYSVKGYIAGTGTVIVQAGVGGTGALLPAFLRVSRG